MKKTRLFFTGCLMLLAVIMCIVCGFYRTPTALASEYSETPVPVESEYNETPASEYANNCDGIGYLPPDPNLTEAENRGRCTWYL